MRGDSERMRLFSRRAVLLGGAQTALFSLLAGRLYYLQIIGGAKYRTLAEENRINLRLIAPPRGQITDRAGAALALNQQNYRVVLLPEQVENLDVLLDKLGNYVTIELADRKRIARDFKASGNLNAVLVKDNLDWEQVAGISLHTLDLPGADIDMGEVRYYPYGAATGHLLGYVGTVSEGEVDDDSGDKILIIPGFRIGKSGIEKQYDLLLRGESGNEQLEVNARGRVVRELARNDPKPGKDIPLTVDIGLQQVIVKRLAAQPGAAVAVLDVRTGAIYAMVSQPGFDPNLFTYGISQEDWDRLNTDEHLPLLDKVTAGVYAPGSTFKPITALAALEADIVDPDARVFCPGYYELGDYKFHCWKHGGHGSVNMREAIAGSCDTYFYDLGRKTGIDRIQAMAKRFGMGSKTGIDLPHEHAGLVPGRAWKFATEGKSWQQGETLIASIGQGYMLTTPLQLAVAVARIANGGKKIVPHLLKPSGSEREDWPNLDLDSDHLSFVQDAMTAVVNEQIGTAYSARIIDEKGVMSMAGKTGTAQVKHISESEREEGLASMEDTPWKERDHALFMGFGPVENPRYAVAVVVEHGGSGAHTAAPIARDILIECQKKKLA